MAIVIFPGTFDPITNGHIDVLEAALHIAQRVYVAIGVHPRKSTLFTAQERKEMIVDATKNSGLNLNLIEVVTFDNLLVHKARQLGADTILRGLRDGADFSYEMQMAGMNHVMASDIKTMFVPARPANQAITSTLVRQIAEMAGDVTSFVPKNVANALKEKFPLR